MTKRRKRSYPLGSTAVSENVWFYADRNGLHVLTQHYNGQGQYVATASAKLPWRFITRALSMHRRVQAERKAAKKQKR